MLTKTCDPNKAEKLERLKRWPGLLSRWSKFTVCIYSTLHGAYMDDQESFTVMDAKEAKLMECSLAYQFCLSFSSSLRKHIQFYKV